jgi:cytochrome P450
MTPIFGEGVVFDAPLAVKAQQLKFVAGALKGTALRSYVAQIVEECEAFFDGWGESGQRDLLDEMANLTILTVRSRPLAGVLPGGRPRAGAATRRAAPRRRPAPPRPAGVALPARPRGARDAVQGVFAALQGD